MKTYGTTEPAVSVSAVEEKGLEETIQSRGSFLSVSFAGNDVYPAWAYPLGYATCLSLAATVVAVGYVTAQQPGGIMDLGRDMNVPNPNMGNAYDDWKARTHNSNSDHVLIPTTRSNENSYSGFRHQIHFRFHSCVPKPDRSSPHGRDCVYLEIV